MRGRPAAIEQTGVAQHERRDTDRRNSARLPMAASQELHDVRGWFLDIGRRPDEHGIERDVVRSLGLGRHAEGVEDQAAVCRDNVRLVIRLAQHHVRGLENRQRSKAEIREARWQKQTDVKNGELPIEWDCIKFYNVGIACPKWWLLRHIERESRTYDIRPIPRYRRGQ